MEEEKSDWENLDDLLPCIVEKFNYKKYHEDWVVSIPWPIPSWRDVPCIAVKFNDEEYNKMVIVASSVCRSWRDALTSGITTLTLYYGWFAEKNLMSNLVRSVVPKFRSLTYLNLHFSPEDDESAAAVEAIAVNCSNLTRLQINCLRLSDASLRALGRGCSQLQILVLFCYNISDSGLLHLLRCCGDLRYLYLQCQTEAVCSDWLLQAVSSHCSRLQGFFHLSSDNVTDDGIKRLVAGGCPRLHALALSNARITDEGVMALERVGYLHLYNCEKITDRALYALAERGKRRRRRGGGLSEDVGGADGHGNGRMENECCNELQHLTLYNCSALTASALQKVVDAWPALHTSNCSKKKQSLFCDFSHQVRCACAIYSTTPHCGFNCEDDL